jgi:response regulator RpfG family c-di-GMP phosphodiesterase
VSQIPVTKKIKVLIIGNILSQRDTIKTKLSKFCYPILAGSFTLGALRYKIEPADMVFMDSTANDTNIENFIEWLKIINPNVHIVVFTSRNDSKDKIQHLTKIGVADFILMTPNNYAVDTMLSLIKKHQ